MPMMSVIDNGLDLIFLFVFDQVRRWPCEVGTVGRGLSIGQEQRGVEHVMNAP